MPYDGFRWGDAIGTSLYDAWAGVAGFIPQLVTALLVFIIGWVIAVFIGHLVEQVIRALKVDSLLEKLEVEKALERGGIKLNSGTFIGGLVKWFLIIVFLLAAVSILNLSQLKDFLTQVLLYIPNVIVSALILIIALKLAEVVERVVRSSVETVGLRGAMAGVTVRWAIWIFAVIAALDQLGIKFASVLFQTLVTGVVVTLALAFGLAFGLGGRDAAASFIDKVRRDIGGR